ncbi:hypothetical protein [Flavobacterium piscis]|uniref:Uncharacterized protein n=1 Tax=Flavobacterium piscis TaxID=1114874 RepID=A0ABU1YAK7_9FLAO|nr:hypothetical protein [Flavobacterium piscis]MDR7211239.1 hypothetical protein [Flavobacterium piscis]
MLKKILLASLFLNSLISFSQEIVSSTAIELKKDVQIFQVVNDSAKQTTMFIADENRIKTIRLDDKMKFIDSLSSQRPEKSYSKMIGNITSGNITTLFWTTSNQKKILSQSFNSKNKKISDKAFDLEFKNEVYLQEFSAPNKFVILTLLKKSNIFKLYIIDNQGNLKIKDLDLSGIRFYHRTNLYDTFEEDFMPFERSFSLVKIDSEYPNSLLKTAAKRKCYLIDNQIVITIDSNQNYTQIIHIDLENYNVSSKNVLQTPFKNFGTSNLTYNSFFMNGNLYQIKSSSDKFYLTIKDSNGNLVKEYVANGNNPIEFKNSAISQQGGNFAGGERTLETSSQFIRKLNGQNSGISCYQTGENIILTTGSVSSENSGGTQAVLNQFGLIGAIISVAVYSPFMESFNSYSGRKAVTIFSLFDKDGNHVKGDLQPLAYDKISTFLQENKKTNVQNLFKVDGLYYLGYYDKEAKQFTIRKFAD